MVLRSMVPSPQRSPIYHTSCRFVSSSGSLAIFAAIRRASPQCIVVIIVIVTQWSGRADAAIGFVGEAACVGCTTFIKRFIAIWTIVVVFDVTLFRPLITGIITRAIDGTV